MKHFQKTLLSLLTVGCVGAFALQAAACDFLSASEPTETPDEHTHTFHQKVVEVQYEKTPATCAQDGVYFKSCSCGEKGEETFTTPALPHTGAICELCLQDVSSQGLEYTLSSDGKSYRLSGAGTCTDERLYIPSTYNGLPVVMFDSSAFYQSAYLTHITVPDSVTLIANATFFNCWNLQSFVVPDSVQSLGFNLFYECGNLSEITIGSGVQSIGQYAFYGCNSLKTVRYTGDIAGWCAIKFVNHNSNPTCKGANLYINGELLTALTVPESVTKLHDYAFQYCLSLEQITTLNTLQSIGSFAFTNCKDLTSVNVSLSVSEIGYGTFSGCESLTSVAFASGKDWFVTTSEQDFQNKVNGTLVDVSDATQAAIYLKDTYTEYYWYAV